MEHTNRFNFGVPSHPCLVSEYCDCCGATPGLPCQGAWGHPNPTKPCSPRVLAYRERAALTAHKTAFAMALDACPSMVLSMAGDSYLDALASSGEYWANAEPVR